MSYRHRVRVRAMARVRITVMVRFSVKFRNLHYYISDKWTIGQVNRRFTVHKVNIPAHCTGQSYSVLTHPAHGTTAPAQFTVHEVSTFQPTVQPPFISIPVP